MRRAALALVVVAGCVPATGVIVEVQGPTGTTSVAAGITTLELVTAHQSYCDRWIQDDGASRTRADVTGRDLTARPYDFLVSPTHQTDLSQPVYYAALAFDAAGKLLGEATFGAHAFTKDEVLKHQAALTLFPAGVGTTGHPQYVSSDGCVCVPGEPWLGTATGTGCDPLVVTSFDRLQDTVGCELVPKGAALPVPRCDGQQFPDEPTDRTLPCWSDDHGTCRVGTRACADHDGQAWARECRTDSGDPALPSGSPLCGRYSGCESACGDVTACFTATLGAPIAVTCSVRVDPHTAPGQPIKPCVGDVWRGVLPSGGAGGIANGCMAAMVQGVDQPPFTLGFSDLTRTGAQPLALACPLAFQIDAIDAPDPMSVPSGKTIDVVFQDRLMRVTLAVEQCNGGGLEPSLVCRAQ